MDAKGYSAAAKGYSVDAKGFSVDAKGVCDKDVQRASCERRCGDSCCGRENGNQPRKVQTSILGLGGASSCGLGSRGSPLQIIYVMLVGSSAVLAALC
eukprot:9466957-Pyramimonas_sp.AAC.1